jgi:hypothetical protein
MVMLCVHRHGLAACSQHQIDGHRFIAGHVALVVRGLRAGSPPIVSPKSSQPRDVRRGPRRART